MILCSMVNTEVWVLSSPCEEQGCGLVVVKVQRLPASSRTRLCDHK